MAICSVGGEVAIRAATSVSQSIRATSPGKLAAKMITKIKNPSNPARNPMSILRKMSGSVMDLVGETMAMLKTTTLEGRGKV